MLLVDCYGGARALGLGERSSRARIFTGRREERPLGLLRLVFSRRQRGNVCEHVARAWEIPTSATLLGRGRPAGAGNEPADSVHRRK